MLQWFESQRDNFSVTAQMRHIYAGGKVDNKMIGEATSLAMESGLVKADRPVVAMADVNGEVKASARALPEHAKRGVHLGQAMEKAAEALGGTGGGHDVAAAPACRGRRRTIS